MNRLLLLCLLTAGFSAGFSVGFSSVASARVFSFQNNWVAGYIRGTAGPSGIGDEAYSKTSGNSTDFTDEVSYNFSGEFGFSFLLNDKLALRAGLEGVQTRNIKADGANGSTTYMDVESKVTVFNPQVTAELTFQNTDTGRIYGFGGVGYSKVKVSNSYTLTSAGTTQYTGATASYNDAWYANLLSYHLGLGWEFFLVDNVTFSLEGGYRMMDIPKFYYDGSNTNIVRGATGTTDTSDGKTVNDNSGDKMALDMSGYFVGILFRFYIPPLD